MFGECGSFVLSFAASFYLVRATWLHYKRNFTPRSVLFHDRNWAAFEFVVKS